MIRSYRFILDLAPAEMIPSAKLDLKKAQSASVQRARSSVHWKSNAMPFQSGCGGQSTLRFNGDGGYLRCLS
jgi:hypothetical protein